MTQYNDVDDADNIYGNVDGDDDDADGNND